MLSVHDQLLLTIVSHNCIVRSIHHSVMPVQGRASSSLLAIPRQENTQPCRGAHCRMVGWVEGIAQGMGPIEEHNYFFFLRI